MGFKEFFGVKENFKVPLKLLDALLTDTEGTIERLRDAGLLEDSQTNIDNFQDSHADRNELKQDFTPECVRRLVHAIAKKGSYCDICAGVGGLTIGNEEKAETIYAEEISERAIPFLLLGLITHNHEGYVVHGDSLTRKNEAVYKLTRGAEYSGLEKVEKCEAPEVFDSVVSNPPYSLKWDSKGFAGDERFKDYGLSPNKAADYMFVLHGLSKLKDDGVGVFILPHGVLFRGNSEGEIRRRLLERNLVDAIIGMPEKLFLNTAIPVFLMILKKNREEGEKILFIDASSEFIKGSKQNNLSDDHIEKILTVYKQRLEVKYYSKLVSFEKIKENDFNLNIPRYVPAVPPPPPPDLLDTCTELIKIEREEAEVMAILYEMANELFTEDERKTLGLEKMKEYFQPGSVALESLARTKYQESQRTHEEKNVIEIKEEPRKIKEKRTRTEGGQISFGL